MARKSGRLAFFALVTWVSSACADSGILDLIPGDAAAAVGIRNLNDLNKKGDQLIADTGVEEVFGHHEIQLEPPVPD